MFYSFNNKKIENLIFRFFWIIIEYLSITLRLLWIFILNWKIETLFVFILYIYFRYLISCRIAVKILGRLSWDYCEIILIFSFNNILWCRIISQESRFYQWFYQWVKFVFFRCLFLSVLIIIWNKYESL